MERNQLISSGAEAVNNSRYRYKYHPVDSNWFEAVQLENVKQMMYFGQGKAYLK